MGQRDVLVGVVTALRDRHKVVHRPSLLRYALAADVATPAFAFSEDIQPDRLAFLSALDSGSTKVSVRSEAWLCPFVVALGRCAVASARFFKVLVVGASRYLGDFFRVGEAPCSGLLVHQCTTRGTIGAQLRQADLSFLWRLCRHACEAAFFSDAFVVGISLAPALGRRSMIRPAFTSVHVFERLASVLPPCHAGSILPLNQAIS